MFCVFHPNFKIMETNGSTNKKGSFIQESSQSWTVYFLENAGAQVPISQYHRLQPGIWGLDFSLEFFTHGQECKKHSTICKWVTRATIK